MLTMTSLQSAINDLACSFVAAMLDAIKGAPIGQLPGEPTDGERRPVARTSRRAPMATPKPSRARGGRLPRRSPEDITKALDEVLNLLKRNKQGLRAEQIRNELGMQAKEMPRILKAGMSTRKLKARGQKRATTYMTG
jgi:hypothetical protein